MLLEQAMQTKHMELQDTLLSTSVQDLRQYIFNILTALCTDVCTALPAFSSVHQVHCRLPAGATLTPG